jgi:acyl-CoA hydrolase
MAGPVILDSERPDLTRFIAPGDGIVFGQACAEPMALVDAVLEQAPTIGRLRMFAGPTWRSSLAEHPREVEVISYGALGKLRRVRDLQVVPARMSQLPRLFAGRQLPGDVVLVQVSPPDAHGRCSFGVGVDYLADAIEHARVVIAEVNDHCPRSSGPTLAWERFDALVRVSHPLVEAPVSVPGSVERAIAAHVADLVCDGDTMQIGVGSLPDAIMQALHGHARLGLHSGMITDGVLDLIERRVLTGADKLCDTGRAVAGAALGSRRLFEALEERADIVLRPVSYTHSPLTLSRVGRLCAINAALEIDLTGQINSEAVGGRALGAAGGQSEFMRAAADHDGTAIVALPAARVVEELSGPVSAARSDVDWVVTEHGARCLRGLTLDERRAALIEIAPEIGALAA